MWQSFFVSSYWRNGPVLNNALSGLDQALWDIKGKRANMPVYQLLGGKSRFAVDAYAHADGKAPEEVAENVQKYMDQGFRYVRIQQGGYGSLYLAQQPDFKGAGFGRATDDFMDANAYVRAIPKLFREVRKRCGEEIDLLHDTHERVQPLDMINMCKRIEEYSPYWIEDPVSPENMDWFKQLRASTTVPFAMGELFNNPNELPCIPDRGHYPCNEGGPAGRVLQCENRLAWPGGCIPGRSRGALSYRSGNLEFRCPGIRVLFR
jgi:mannonate dehydratase